MSIRSCSRDSFREQLFYAVPLGLATIVVLVFGQTDKYVITHFLGREVFAVYAVGTMQLPFVDILRNSVMNVVFPLMAGYQKKGDLQGMLELWRRATLKIAVYRVRPVNTFIELALAGAANLLAYFGLCLAFRFTSISDIKSMFGRANA